jgi:hypothetical protein
MNKRIESPRPIGLVPKLLTLTITGDKPSLPPCVSIYFFRSQSKNSNTRYNLESECTISSSLSLARASKASERASDDA